MPWVKSWDDSFSPVPISRLQEMYDKDYRVWGRYVGPGSDGKHWTAERIAAWFACGPDTGVAFNCEGLGTEAITTPSLGDDHARESRADMRALGVPDRIACAPAVDRDISMAQWKGNVAQYMANYGHADTQHPVAYVEEDAGQYLYDQNLTLGTFTPAAYSWDDDDKLITPSNAPAHVVMTQEHNDVAMAGGRVDIGNTRTDAPHVYWNPAGADMTFAKTDLDVMLHTDGELRNWPWKPDSPESGGTNTQQTLENGLLDIGREAHNAHLSADANGAAIAALATAVAALTTGGTSLDTTAVLNAIQAVAATVAAVQADLDSTKAALATALGAR